MIAQPLARLLCNKKWG